MAIRPGIYKHYKGNLYEVIEEATHSETGEKLVVYRPLYGERALWVRPSTMFAEQVQVDGRSLPRFALQPPAASQPDAAKLAGAAAATVTASPAQPSSAAADTSLDARVRAAMAKADERPDFSSLPVFEDRRQALRLGLIAIALIALLVWLL